MYESKRAAMSDTLLGIPRYNHPYQYLLHSETHPPCAGVYTYNRQLRLCKMGLGDVTTYDARKMAMPSATAATTIDTQAMRRVTLDAVQFMQ
jgi:hypothetical protein